MFGINKNGTKHKIGIIMPASYPASRVSYNGGTAEDALDDLNTDSGWLTTTAVNGNTVYYRKIRNQVWVRRGTNGTISANTLTTVGNLPSGYRPIANAQFGVISEASDYGEVIVKSNGDVQVRCIYANTQPAFYVSVLTD